MSSWKSYKIRTKHPSDTLKKSLICELLPLIKEIARLEAHICTRVKFAPGASLIFSVYESCNSNFHFPRLLFHRKLNFWKGYYFAFFFRFFAITISPVVVLSPSFRRYLPFFCRILFAYTKKELALLPLLIIYFSPGCFVAPTIFTFLKTLRGNRNESLGALFAPEEFSFGFPRLWNSSRILQMGWGAICGMLALWNIIKLDLWIGSWDLTKNLKWKTRTQKWRNPIRYFLQIFLGKTLPPNETWFSCKSEKKTAGLKRKKIKLFLADKSYE